MKMKKRLEKVVDFITNEAGENLSEWKALEKMWVKINCDGTCNKEMIKVAVGVVARNVESKMISGM